MTKEKWMELFNFIGLTEEQMHKWHKEFEKRYPQDHQAFLQWLHIPEQEIEHIRKRFSK